jgi:hypothetical protein
MKFVSITIVALALDAPTALTASTSTWRVVKSKSVSGQFAATGISATIRHPKGIAVGYIGSGVQSTAAWGCSKGISVSSWSRRYGKGLHVLAHVSERLLRRRREHRRSRPDHGQDPQAALGSEPYGGSGADEARV